MEAVANVARASFRLRSRHDARFERVARGCQQDAALSVACTPHPRPLPATRFARGGRGADLRSSNLNSKSRSPGSVRKRPAGFSMYPRFAAGLGQLADAQDVALAFGYRDHAAGVEQVEDVACLDALVVGRQRHQVFLAITARSWVFLPSGREIFLA